MTNTLPPAEHKRRLRLYRKGLFDDAIGRRVGKSKMAIVRWRTKHDLPSHRKRGRPKTRSPETKPLRFAGVNLYYGLRRLTIQQKRAAIATRPQWERLLIRKFATDLIICAENCEKPDIGAFMAKWREVRSSYVKELPRD